MKGVLAHPEYPFAEANLEATVLEIDRFIADPELSSAERGEVLEFVRLTRQYAFLEKLIQGEILCDLPIHFDLLKRNDGTPEDLAERIAEKERELLGLGVHPAEMLMDALDDRGIKVFRRSHGPESPEDLTGGFHYAGQYGPALLGAGLEGCPEAVFVVAHEYGHLVMDVSPYRSRFCRWTRHDLSNISDTIEERRADRFARALLLPAESVRAYARELALDDPGGAPSAETIARAAEAFGVAPALLWRRLDDLGLKRPAKPPEPISLDDCREVDDLRPTDLPERFVNLALAAFGQRLIEKKQLSKFLRIRPERLEKFLAWCPIPRAPGRPDDDEDEDLLEKEAGE